MNKLLFMERQPQRFIDYNDVNWSYLKTVTVFSKRKKMERLNECILKRNIVYIRRKTSFCRSKKGKRTLIQSNLMTRKPAKK